MSSEIDQLHRLCNSMHVGSLESCFELVSNEGGCCSYCQAPIDVGEVDLMYCHMHMFLPSKTSPSVHGSGRTGEAAKQSAISQAVAMLLKCDSGIFSFKRARLRARLEDFGFTLPPRPSGARQTFLQSIENGDNATAAANPVTYPPSFLDMLEDEFSSDSSKKFFLDLCKNNLQYDQIEHCFIRLGLSLVDECHESLNEYLFGALVLLCLRIRSFEEEQCALSFLKIFEQVLVYAPDKGMPSGITSTVLSRMVRFFLSLRAIPFMAKNRMEVISVQLLGARGSQVVKALEKDIAQYELEDSGELAQIVMDRMPPVEYLESLHAEFEKINRVIMAVFGVEGQIYGSLANGFPTKSSDVDVVVNLKEYLEGVWEEEEKDEQGVVAECQNNNCFNNDTVEKDTDAPLAKDVGTTVPVTVSDKKNLLSLNKLYDALMSDAETSDQFLVTKIVSARVPIMKCRNKANNVEIDISFNHEVVVHNSDLLRAYSSFSQKVKQLVVLIKYWAKQRDVNDSLQGTLSSYSYVLLVIHYLQKIGCLPDLQNPPTELCGAGVPVRLCDHGKCSSWFWKCDERDVDYSIWFPLFRDKIEKTSLKRLFLGFFEYYLWDFNFLTNVVTVTSSSCVSKNVLFESDPGLLRRRTWLSILDPFEKNRVLGASARGNELIVKEMRRAVELILDAKFTVLFEEYKKRERPVGAPLPVRQLGQCDNGGGLWTSGECATGTAEARLLKLEHLLTQIEIGKKDTVVVSVSALVVLCVLTSVALLDQQELSSFLGVQPGDKTVDVGRAGKWLAKRIKELKNGTSNGSKGPKPHVSAPNPAVSNIVNNRSQMLHYHPDHKVAKNGAAANHAHNGVAGNYAQTADYAQKGHYPPTANYPQISQYPPGWHSNAPTHYPPASHNNPPPTNYAKNNQYIRQFDNASAPPVKVLRKPPKVDFSKNPHKQLKNGAPPLGESISGQAKPPTRQIGTAGDLKK